VNVGRVHSLLGEFPSAWDAYATSLEQFAGNAEGWLGKAQCEQQLKRSAEAHDSYLMFIRLQPSRPEGYFGVAEVLQMEVLGNPQAEEAKTFRSATDDDAQLRQVDRINQIINFYDQAESRGMPTLRILSSRVPFLMYLGRLDEAEQDLLTWLKEDPNEEQAQRLLREVQRRRESQVNWRNRGSDTVHPPLSSDPSSR